uniref:Oxoglutarate (alpha-ketoglutarate) receptor 1b n=1 Tax=Astyanax mexicanus TaxID=7994 RepID=A0A8B9K607_ASTMX
MLFWIIFVIFLSYLLDLVLLIYSTMEKHFNGSADCYTLDLYIKHHYLPIMYGVIFLVGVVGNLLAFTVYLVKLRPWKSSSIIMVNLVVADLLYTLSLPFLVQFYATMNWTLGEFMCRFLRFCFYFNLYGSILFLTCHSIFRYIAVVHPLKAAQIQRKRWGITVCLAVWAISLVEIGPMLSMITTKKKGITIPALTLILTKACRAKVKNGNLNIIQYKLF